MLISSSRIPLASYPPPSIFLLFSDLLDRDSEYPESSLASVSAVLTLVSSSSTVFIFVSSFLLTCVSFSVSICCSCVSTCSSERSSPSELSMSSDLFILSSSALLTLFGSSLIPDSTYPSGTMAGKEFLTVDRFVLFGKCKLGISC